MASSSSSSTNHVGSSASTPASSTTIPSSSSSGNRLMPSLSNPGDIAVWLHNKLSSDDIWSDKSSIITQLNSDMLTSIKSCFTELQLNVKLKLLLSFLHLPKRNLDDWKNELEELIRLAIDDSDPWVSVVAELLENYPRHGSIDLDPTSSSFSELSTELKKLVKKQDQKILPLESLFLNRCAFHSQFGQPAQPVKHFQLKRKAKSATLRAELLQKATDLSSGRRPSTGPTVPIRCRGLNSNDTTPYKGIPSRNSFGSYSSSSFKSGLSRLSSSSGGISNSSSSRSARLAASNIGSSGIKRDGGIVLLDMYEAPSAPINQRDLKRQRKDKEKEKQQEKSDKQQQPQQTSSSTIPSTTTSSNISSSQSKTRLMSSSSDDDHLDHRQSLKSQKSEDSNIKTTASSTTTKSSLLNRNNSIDNESTSVIKTPIMMQKNLSKFSNTKNDDNNIIQSQQSLQTQQSSIMNTSNQSLSNQQRQILASKSTPDYAAGLTPVPSSSSSSSVITTSTTNQKLDDSRINQQQQQQQSSLIDSTPVQQSQPQQQSSSLYHEQQQQQQSSPLKTTQSLYQQNQNQFNNQQQQQQQIRMPIGSSNFTMLNQSLMAQRSTQSQQQQQQQQSEMRVPLQQQMLAYQQQQQQQQQQNRNNFQTSNIQQLQQNSSQQFTQQQQQIQSIHRPFGQQPQQQQQQNRPQLQQQTFSTPFGMYAGTTSTQQQQQQSSPQQQQQQQPNLPLQGLSASAGQLMREIMTKFPRLNPQIHKTIYDFLNGLPNPSPESGPQRQFRLGETIELRKRSPDQPETRHIVETQLLIDYDKKTCKKLENIKQLPDFQAIRTVGIVGNSSNPQQQQPPHLNVQSSGHGGIGMPIRMATFQTVGPRGMIGTVGQRMMTTTNRAGVPVTFMAINPSFLQQSQQHQHQQQLQQQQQQGQQQNQQGPPGSTTGNQSSTMQQYSHLQQRV